MFLILKTLMLALSLTGLAVCIYAQQWIVAITAAPFSVQFAQMFYQEYRKYKALLTQIKKLEAENKLLRTFYKRHISRGIK